MEGQNFEIPEDPSQTFQKFEIPEDPSQTLPERSVAYGLNLVDLFF